MKTALSILLLLLLRIACFGQDSVVIGVIEKNIYSAMMQTPGGWMDKPHYHNMLRLLFRKQGDGWIAVDSLPPKFTFYQFGVKTTSKGVASKRDKYDHYYASGGSYHKVQGKYTLYTMEIAGIDPERIFEQKDIVRYAVVTNNPKALVHSLVDGDISVLDKQALVDSIKSRTKRSSNIFPRTIPKDTVYENEYRRYLENYANNYQPILDSIKIVDCFLDKKGNTLFGIDLPVDVSAIISGSLTMTNFREDNAVVPRLFCVVRPNKEIKLFFADMFLMDHGDFDNNGSDEYLFFYHIHNHDGYILVYDNFTKYVSNTWSYH